MEEHLRLTKAGAKPVEVTTPIGRLSRMDAIQQQEMTKASRMNFPETEATDAAETP